MRVMPSSGLELNRRASIVLCASAIQGLRCVPLPPNSLNATRPASGRPQARAHSCVRMRRALANVYRPQRSARPRSGIGSALRTGLGRNLSIARTLASAPAVLASANRQRLVAFRQPRCRPAPTREHGCLLPFVRMPVAVTPAPVNARQVRRAVRPIHNCRPATSLGSGYWAKLARLHALGHRAAASAHRVPGVVGKVAFPSSAFPGPGKTRRPARSFVSAMALAVASALLARDVATRPPAFPSSAEPTHCGRTRLLATSYARERGAVRENACPTLGAVAPRCALRSAATRFSGSTSHSARSYARAMARARASVRTANVVVVPRAFPNSA
jgi:hypothetical protein